MPEKGTQIVFDATVTGVKIAGTAGQYGGASKGSLDVTFRVDRPARPRPLKSFNGPEPSAEDFDKPSKYKRALKAWEKNEAQFAEAMATYDRLVEELRPRLVSYAQLAGMAAVLDGNLVTVEVRPGEQHNLPGFGLELLAAPEEV